MGSMLKHLQTLWFQQQYYFGIQTLLWSRLRECKQGQAGLQERDSGVNIKHVFKEVRQFSGCFTFSSVTLQCKQSC